MGWGAGATAASNSESDTDDIRNGCARVGARYIGFHAPSAQATIPPSTPDLLLPQPTGRLWLRRHTQKKEARCLGVSSRGGQQQLPARAWSLDKIRHTRDTLVCL